MPKYCLWMVTLVFFAFSLTAQITITPSTGCAPLSVQLSGPAGASNVHWTLGPGMGSSSLPSPNPLYSNPGTYNITYTAMVGGNAVSYSGQVVVTTGPSGSYSFQQPATHCAPMTVTLSGSGGSPGSTYQWSFGDLTPLGSGANLVHTYNISGAFVPVMTIVDAVTGCTAVAVNNSGTVNVSAPPNLVISSQNGFVACAAPMITVFSASLSTSNSPKSGALSAHSWTFAGGNPATGTGMNPGSVQFGAGTHTVYLSATDNNQCSATTSSLVTVVNPSLSFALQPTICLYGAALYTLNTQEPVTYWNIPEWNTGLTSYTNFPIVSYTTGGLKTMTVTVIPGGVCPALTATGSVFVEEVVAQFTTTPPFASCQPSMVVTYTNLTTTNAGSALSYTWLIDGGGPISNGTPTSSTLMNPSFTLTQQSKNPYSIYKAWGPKVWLFVESSSPAKCKSQIWHEFIDTLQRPTSWFYTSRKFGCAPLSVKFYDSSFTIIPKHAISGFTLHNGAVPSASVSGNGAFFPYTFTYPSVGTYTPWMIVETVTGCIDTSFVDTIRVVNPPSVGMTYTPNLEVCAGDPVEVNLTASPSSSLIQQWHVTSDNGFFSGCINDSSPTWAFTHVGVHGFTIHALQQGCESKLATSQSITVKGPMGKFRYRTSCSPGVRKNILFNVHLQEVSTATLNFGDGNSLQISGNPGGAFSYSVNHTYASSGDYTAVLTSANSSNGCPNRMFTQKVTVRDAKARITHKFQTPPSLPLALGCSGKVFKFEANSSQDAEVDCSRGYAWRLYYNNTINPYIDKIDSSFSTPVLAAGVHTLILRVKDANSCLDYDTLRFRISSATPSFTFPSNPYCHSNGPLQLINNTQSLQTFPDTIVNYHWYFGDGSAPLSDTNPFSSPQHTYNFVAQPSQTFVVAVTATNNVGCSDSASAVIQINNPSPGVLVKELFPCLRKNSAVTVTLSASPGYATYSVNYGQGGGWTTSPTFSSGVVQYTVPGRHTATVIVEDNATCRAGQVVTVTVIGQPTAAIMFPGNENKFCVPATPTLVSTTLLNQTAITNTLWSIGNIQTPPPGTGTFVNQIFVSPGVTTIKLTVDSAGFCPSSATAQVIVSDPKAEIKLNKNVFCLGDTINVSIRDSSLVEGWRWFFGDNIPQTDIIAGSVLASITRTISYPYTVLPSDSSGKTVLSLRYFGTVGSCVRTATADIQVLKIFAGLAEDMNDDEHCLGEADQFTTKTPNPAGMDLQYNWLFGDGKTGTGSNLFYTYTAPGLYKVTLIVSDRQYGCPDSATKNIRVFPLPQASISIAPDFICPEQSFVISGTGTPGVSGALTGTINPTVNFSFDAANQFTVQHSVGSSAVFSLQVTDENLCVSEQASAEILVQTPPPAKHWDTTVIRGEIVPLNAYAGSASFSYSWTPEVTGLSCITCFDPVSTVTNAITYTVLVVDEPLQCFITASTFSIFIDTRVTLDVPTAFTPNGDGVNDVIKPDGWGLKRLHYFRIYNRWGELLFVSNDLNVGWDGTFQGLLQNNETYVYQVAAETYTEEVLTKSGSFKLLR